MDFIDLKTQYRKFQPEILARINSVLEHGRFIMGPEIEELESTLADYLACKHAITVASGTDSLEIALRALEIAPGGEVVTVPFTWISTRKSSYKSVRNPSSWISTRSISTSLWIASRQPLLPPQKRSCL